MNQHTYSELYLLKYINKKSFLSKFLYILNAIYLPTNRLKPGLKEISQDWKRFKITVN